MVEIKKLPLGARSACPRCGWRMEERRHKKITEKQLKQPFYYSQWYCCTNKKCKTTLVMPEEFKIFPKNQDIVLEVLERGAAIVD